MKIIRFLVVALMAMVGLNSCSDEQNFIDVDHSADLVGTWTCVQPDYAGALVINADGSAVSTVLQGGELRENVQGSVTVENNKISLKFEDGHNFDGRFELIPRETLLVIDAETGNSITYRYCDNDLTDEIVGMWVSTEEVFGQEEESVAIITYNENGKAYLTGFSPDVNGYLKQMESDYKVYGNLMISSSKVGPDMSTMHIAVGFDIIPNGTELGDIMTTYDPWKGTTPTFLRVRQTLDLPNQKYDYSNIYITNVKAKDADFEFAGQTLNLATMDGKFLDKMLKNILFNVSFPTSDEIVYNCYYNGQSVSMPAPIVVDGNKMTIRKSAKNPVYKDIDVWTFQDQDNTQMHMYMPTYTFENFLANTIVEMMANDGKLDLNDAEAVAAIYDAVAEAIETINVSFIFKDATRAL